MLKYFSFFKEFLGSEKIQLVIFCALGLYVFMAVDFSHPVNVQWSSKLATHYNYLRF